MRVRGHHHAHLVTIRTISTMNIHYMLLYLVCCLRLEKKSRVIDLCLSYKMCIAHVPFKLCDPKIVVHHGVSDMKCN